MRPPLRFRNTYRWYWWGFFAFLLAGDVLSLLSHPSLGYVLYRQIPPVCVGFPVWRMSSVGVEERGDRLLIRNVRKTHTVSVDAIEGFDVARLRGGKQLIVRVVTAGGRIPVDLLTTSRPSTRAEWTRLESRCRELSGWLRDRQQADQLRG